MDTSSLLLTVCVELLHVLQLHDSRRCFKLLSYFCVVAHCNCQLERKKTLFSCIKFISVNLFVFPHLAWFTLHYISAFVVSDQQFSVSCCVFLQCSVHFDVLSVSMD